MRRTHPDLYRRSACLGLLLATLSIAACDRFVTYTEQEHVQRARDFQKDYKFREAEIELKNAIAKNPKNADARWLLAENFVELGRGVEAEVELNRARELGVPPETLKVALGNAWLLQGKHRRVLAEIKPGTESTQQNTARITEVQARAQLGVGNVRSGCALFKEAQQKDATVVAAYWGMALCDEAQRKLDDARGQLQQALKVAPKDSRTWTTLGDLERRAHRSKEAVSAYTTALRYWPNNLDAMLGRAAVYIRDKQYKEAEQDINRVVSRSRGYFMAVHLHGVLLFSQGKYPEAKGMFERVLKTSPDFSPTMLWLGFTEYALENFETAATYLGNFIARNPGAVRVNAILALMQARRGGGPETEKMLKALREANYDDPRMLMVLGQAYYILKEGDLAVQQLQKAAQLGPEDADIRLNLALALMQQGKTAEALAELEQAIKINPEAKQAEDLLVRTLLAQKRYDEALKAVAAYEARVPKSPAPPTHRANILLTQDRKQNAAAARRELERALKLDRAYLPAAHSLARLAWEEGRHDEARQIYTGVLKSRPAELTTLMALYGLESKAKRPEQARQYLTTAAEKHPGEVGPAALLGQLNLTEGKFVKVIEVTREAARVHPENAQLVELRAAAYRGAGDLRNAQAAFKRLVQLQPKSAEAHYQLATVNASLKDAAGFRGELLQVLAIDPKHIQAKIGLARLELGEGKPAAAARLGRELQKEHPKDAAGFVLESDALAAQGDTAGTVQPLEKYQKQNIAELPPRSLLVGKYLQTGTPEKALKLARETEAAFPGKPEALELLGQTQLAAKDPKGAVETYGRLVKLDPKRVASHYRLARAYQAAGDAKQARASFGRALELQPDYLDAQLALAAADIRAGQHQAAMKIGKQIQTQRPKLAVGYMLEGDMWMEGKDYPKAIRAFEAAYRVQPSSIVATRLHGALEQGGNPMEADSRLEAWVKDNPGELAARKYLADTYMMRGKEEAAAAHYQEIVRANPRDAFVLNNLAWLYHKQRRPKALEMAEQAHKLAPKDAKIMDTLGWILVEQGQVARGAQLLETALSLAPDEAGIRYHRAAALARAELERLLASGKKFPEEEEARRLLQRL